MGTADLAYAPLLLVDAFDALDELRAQASAHEAQQREAAAPQRPGVLR